MSLFQPFDEQSTITDLIIGIYDAALDPSKWRSFKKLLSKRLRGVEPSFHFADNKFAEVRTLFLSHVECRDFMLDYVMHGLADAPVAGMSNGDRELASTTGTMNPDCPTNFNSIYLDPSRTVGTIFCGDDGSYYVFGLHSNAAIYKRYRSELRCVAEYLTPHIQQALRINRQIKLGNASQVQFAAILEKIAVAAVILDIEMRVSHANRMAEALFQSSALRIDSAGKIHAGDRVEETHTLHSAVSDVLKADAGQQHRFLKLTVSGQHDLFPGNSLLVQVMSLANESDGATDCLLPSFFENHEAAALMLICDPQSKESVNLDALLAHFDLTAAECRLAAAIAIGESLEDYARLRGVRKGTVRAQLKSIFAKTNTHRQAELTALVHRLGATSALGK